MLTRPDVWGDGRPGIRVSAYLDSLQDSLQFFNSWLPVITNSLIRQLEIRETGVRQSRSFETLENVTATILYFQHFAVFLLEKYVKIRQTQIDFVSKSGRVCLIIWENLVEKTTGKKWRIVDLQ